MEDKVAASLYSQFGVFLDGVQIEPHAKDLVFFGMDGKTYAFTWYLFKIGPFQVRVYADYYSRVELYSQSFYSKEDLPVPENSSRLLFSLWVRESFLMDCVFTGDNHMTSVHLQSCYLNESDFINQTLRLAGPIENINSHGSSFENFHVSDKGDFVRSQLVNVTYRNDASDTIGKLAYEVYESKLVDCRITGYGENLVYNSTLRNVQISYHGHFGLNRASIDNASFNANTVDIQNKFGFFTIPLPNTLLHVYTDRNEKMCVIEQDGHEIIELSDPDFETKLQLIFINNGEIMLEDISRYVHDCVNSRDRVLKLFNKSQSCNANS